MKFKDYFIGYYKKKENERQALVEELKNNLFVKVYSYEQEYTDEDSSMCMRTDEEDDIENTDWHEHSDIDDEDDCSAKCDEESTESHACSGYDFSDGTCNIRFRVDY